MWIALLLALLAIVVGLAVCLALTYLRRRVLTRRVASMPMAAHLRFKTPGRGWAPGYAVYEGSALHWYRMFSLSWKPRLTLYQGDLVITDRRGPVDGEELMFPAGIKILVCDSSQGVLELAMSPSALTGFSSWSEAAPPGAASSL
ncbi:DUF2550 domain-containing protein [Haloglycomyces albus]|uniref:DUF2550 domain-containing protein n=1 Tax=Haloglycomyces albus TaxID=526067 RepID=UPI00068630AA|nr:DUF2550 domain-containing protein [Haloglycomyces albus]